MVTPDLCPHARPLYVPIGAVIRGMNPCEDCQDEDWNAVKSTHYALLIVLLTLIYVPLLLLLAGVFW